MSGGLLAGGTRSWAYRDSLGQVCGSKISYLRKFNAGRPEWEGTRDPLSFAVWYWIGAEV